MIDEKILREIARLCNSTENCPSRIGLSRELYCRAIDGFTCEECWFEALKKIDITP